MTGPIKAIAGGYRHALNVTGRATRSEYWWFWGFTMVVGLLIFLFLTDETATPTTIVSLIGLAAIGIPQSTCLVRRMIDAGQHRLWAAPWAFSIIVPAILNVLGVEDALIESGIIDGGLAGVEEVSWYGIASMIVMAAAIPGLIFCFWPSAAPAPAE